MELGTLGSLAEGPTTFDLNLRAFVQLFSLAKDEVGHERHQRSVNQDSADHDHDHCGDGYLSLGDRLFILDDEGQRDSPFDVALESEIEHLFKFK